MMFNNPRGRSQATLLVPFGLAILAGATHALAQPRLFVGSPQRQVLFADPAVGLFQSAGICGGPIQSMTQLGSTLMLGDSNGNVYGLDLDKGGVDYYFTLAGSDCTDMVAHGNDLLISSLDGTIRRVNPNTGALLATYTSPVQVQAMILDESFLYVAGPQGNVHRAAAGVGQFEYFACICLGPVNSLAAVGDEILAGDAFGTVLRFSKKTGLIGGGFGMPGDNAAMAPLEGGDLFVADSTGFVRRVNPETGDVSATFDAAIEIRGMTLTANVDCPADFDADGSVTSNDFFRFLDAFLAGAAAADHNADGRVSSDDFFAFVIAFFAGCR